MYEVQKNPVDKRYVLKKALHLYGSSFIRFKGYAAPFAPDLKMSLYRRLQNPKMKRYLLEIPAVTKALLSKEGVHKFCQVHFDALMKNASTCPQHLQQDPVWKRYSKIMEKAITDARAETTQLVLNDAVEQKTSDISDTVLSALIDAHAKLDNTDLFCMHQGRGVPWSRFGALKKSMQAIALATDVCDLSRITVLQDPVTDEYEIDEDVRGRCAVPKDIGDIMFYGRFQDMENICYLARDAAFIFDAFFLFSGISVEVKLEYNNILSQISWEEFLCTLRRQAVQHLATLFETAVDAERHFKMTCDLHRPNTRAFDKLLKLPNVFVSDDEFNHDKRDTSLKRRTFSRSLHVFSKSFKDMVAPVMPKSKKRKAV